MVKILRPAVAVLAAALVLGAVVYFVTQDRQPGPPPLAGSVADFTVARAGSPAPQTALAAEDGKTTTIDSFRGRLVLVNFWATWCAPCVREMPSLARLQKAMGGADFTVLALSEDLKGWPAIAPFLKAHGISGLPVLHDPNGTASRALGVQGLPTTILFDRDGRELGRLLGAAEWDGPDARALLRHYLTPEKRSG